MSADNDDRPLALVAEDDPDLLRLTTYQLRIGGFRTIAASNGLDALKLIVSERPDVAVLDIGMPGLDGRAVLRISQSQGAGAPPVLFLTALGDVKNRVAGLEDGAVDYITKPVAGAELVARCRAALRR
jgi:two-component system response regulator MprA